MNPRGDLTSTRFVLANPRKEYLVLQPTDGTDPFTVTVGPGTYAVEWFSINRRETKSAEKVSIRNDQRTSFTAPFSEAGPVVLYLKQAER